MGRGGGDSGGIADVLGLPGHRHPTGCHWPPARLRPARVFNRWSIPPLYWLRVVLTSRSGDAPLAIMTNPC